jgi:methylenetetrahydrofolate dehydrogenase (NADP+)/methenyltetrahydrofolate cyclohydrolase
MQLIDGKKLRDEILIQVQKEISELSFKPVFCDILVGEDSVSRQYVQMKAKIAESIGIDFHEAFFSKSILTEELVVEIKKINDLPNMCGIIVQLPLPEHIDKKIILDTIQPNLDVDCLGNINSQKFYQNQYILGYPTALACLYLLDFLSLNLQNKKIVVLGQGELVGRPVTALLNFRNLNVQPIDTSTENKERLIKEADIIISAIGRGKYLNSSMVKKNVIIIDAGTSESGSGIVGDVDLESAHQVASFISPVPGGVGPITLAMLFRNILKVAQSK